MQRREFLSANALAAAGVGLAGSSVLAGVESPKQPLIKPGATVLFQGDSITDTRRNRKIAEPNQAAALGNGYAFLASAQLLIDNNGLNVYNRGVSGNKVFQLAERWERDCIALKPDVVSILIGVNDIWHWLKGQYDGTITTYRNDYRALADRTRQALPDAKLVVCEPFVLKTGAVDDKWFPKFDEFRKVAKWVADEFGDAWVPFQGIMDAAVQVAPPETWAGDGVHPTTHGAALMANAWLRAVGA